MIINVASFGGRTHMLDTARELEKFGHTVRFYSYVPTKRAIKYGLKRECSYSLFWFAIPFLALFKLVGFKLWNLHIYHYVFDHFTAWYMKPCDIFIGQSPMHIYSLKQAKKRFNAITILERGTSHVLEQVAILSANPALNGESAMRNKYIKPDLEGYRHADYISVGATHVLHSFTKHGFQKEKIFVNNYGYDISEFEPTTLMGDYDILFVGQWGYRKGADLLTEVCKQKKYKLLHVGAIADVPFPTDIPSMKHVDSVDQKQLIEHYRQAKIFVLPSREEGLALVQAQAMSCGLPIVCSRKSGGIDLRKYTVSDDWIIELNELTVTCLIQGIEKALQMSATQTGKRNYTKKEVTNSWEDYGERYNLFLNFIMN